MVLLSFLWEPQELTEIREVRNCGFSRRTYEPSITESPSTGEFESGLGDAYAQLDVQKRTFSLTFDSLAIVWCALSVTLHFR